MASFLFRKSHHTLVIGFPEWSILAYFWFRKSHHTIVIGLPEWSFLASFGRRKSHRSIVMCPPRGGHFWRAKRDRVHATKTQRVRVAFLELGYLELYLFLFASRPSGPVLSPMAWWPQKHENAAPNPYGMVASKTPFSTPNPHGMLVSASYHRSKFHFCNKYY